MIKATRVSTLFLALLGASGIAAAAPCASSSLASYVTLGAAGCNVGALTFSDFVVEAFPGPTATQIAPSGISLAPVANGFSLSSGTSLSASTDVLLGLRFLFHVAGPSLGGGTVALGSANAVTGDGAITGLLDAGSSGLAIALLIDGVSDTPESFTSAPTSLYSAFFELGIDGGTEGSARLGPQLATLTFANAAPVPEPSIAALSLVGLIGAVAMRRRRARREA